MNRPDAESWRLVHVRAGTGLDSSSQVVYDHSVEEEPSMRLAGSQSRIAIEAVSPETDHGRFPVKRIAGEKIVVEADIFADGHDCLASVLLHRSGDREWAETPLQNLGNDRWRGSFVLEEPGRYEYSFAAWIDRFGSWRDALLRKVKAGQDTDIDYVVGANLVKTAAERAPASAAGELLAFAGRLTSPENSSRSVTAADKGLAELMSKYQERESLYRYPHDLGVIADREKARFSAWYEMFPRSCVGQPGKHGTFRDCEERLPYIAGMGFDVLYFPPVHPVSRVLRRGRNNAPLALPEDPGSPWAIGSEEGGHKAVNPELGTLEDFRRLVERARDHGIEIALDIALNCSPTHPYVREHPEWFSWRPDGTVQYAENPPKLYQDIYPFNFQTGEWRALWREIESIFLFWIGQGVRIFRVDNPHTKPFAFWEWLIKGIKGRHPDVIFLSEAFTRPKIMYRLAKLGFTQSYTYFAWRNTKWELTQYFTELARTPVCDFFRPNLWPNTPDILTAYLQNGGKPAFKVRLVLAATLGPSYGIYGPAFELGENHPREPGSEEYLNSEKYEIRVWPLDSPASLRDFIAKVNRIRRENRAFQRLSLDFHRVDNDQLLCYSKRAEDGSGVMLMAVNLDYRYIQSGWTALSLDALGVDPARPFAVHDVLSGEVYTWQGPRNYIELNPHTRPAHIFRVTQEKAK